MPENAPAPVRASATATASYAPRPVSPVDEEVVDALAVHFSWEPAATDGVGYVLQVAGDADFREVLATVSVGSATALTLYDTIPADREGTLHWRVRPEGQKEWGPAASFHVLSSETRAARLAQEEEAARARAEAATRRATADIHRHLDDDSEHVLSSRLTAAVLVAIVASFLVLILLLMLVGQVVWPAEAIT